MMLVQKAMHLYQELDKGTPKCTGVLYDVLEKYDGWYGYMDIGKQPSLIHSRAGRPIPSLVEFSKRVHQRWMECNTHEVGCRLIFEILLADVPEFTTLNGILNRSKGDCQAKNVYVRVHDWVSPDHLVQPFHSRYQQAMYLVEKLDMYRVKQAPLIARSSNERVWRRKANEIWAEGGEGVILKRAHAGYSPGKRNCDVMKIKEDITLEMLVVGRSRGKSDGKYARTLGTIQVQEANGTTHDISGMTDRQRNDWWNKPRLIMGQVVEVKAMKRLKDGSLREPRFKAIRHDKLKSEID
jgi:ATP-dependent DNA ligase